MSDHPKPVDGDANVLAVVQTSIRGPVVAVNKKMVAPTEEMPVREEAQ